MRALQAVAVAVAILSASAAGAQPEGDKGDAKALLASGLKLFAAKDYLGALSVFETAYQRYPSPKILLNIGTTLIKLDRQVEAANVYQRYLDAKDVDEKKQAEARKILAGLDRELGVLDLTVTPDNAELQIGDGRWTALDTVRKIRVAKGEVTILARAPRFKLRAETLTIGAGETRAVALVLEEEPAVRTQPTTDPIPGAGIVNRVERADRSRLAVIGAWHVDPFAGNDNFAFGNTFLAGIAFDALPQLAVHATALIGKRYGAYAGASYALLRGRVRPLVSAGVPIVFSNGARVSVRGAAGVELAINRHLAVIAEVGVERFLNKEDSVVMESTLFVPGLAVTGRL